MCMNFELSCAFQKPLAEPDIETRVIFCLQLITFRSYTVHSESEISPFIFHSSAKGIK